MRGPPAQSLSRAMVQTIHDHGQFLIGYGIKGPGLGQILPHQAVGVLVGSPLPGGVRVREVGRGFEPPVDIGMPGELQAVVKGQRRDTRLERSERLHNGIPDRLAGLAGHMSQQAEAGLALDQTDDGLLADFTDQCIALPVTDPATRLNTGGTLCNRPAVWNLAPAVLPRGVAFAALLLAAQVAP